MPYTHSGFIQRNRKTLVFFYKIADSAIIGLSLFVAVLFRLGFGNWQNDFTLPLLFSLLLFQVCAELNESYRSWRGTPIQKEVANVLLTWGQTLVIMVITAYFLKVSDEYSRFIFGMWSVLGGVLLSVSRGGIRLMFRRFRARGYNTRRVAIAGAGNSGKMVAAQILENGWLGYVIEGFYSDFEARGSRPLPDRDLEVQGTLQDLLDRARAGEIDQVYIAFGPQGFHNMTEFVSALADTTASIYVVPDPLVFSLLKGQLADMAGMPVVKLFDTPFWGVGGMAKRLEDLILTTVILMIIALPMACIALAVKLTSPGPVLFKQRRYGLDGREIEVWKFRSMTVCEDGGTIEQARKCDPRITPLGGFLRITSLDELPQFINVFQGNMSIVGPRPHAVAHNEHYRKLVFGYMLRHKVKPGITGWAQVNGFRGETDTLEKMQKRIEHDLWYIQHWNFWLDIRIIVLTVFKGFLGKNAY